jgi:TM2 domain-containing membrane protein YozV
MQPYGQPPMQSYQQPPTQPYGQPPMMPGYGQPMAVSPKNPAVSLIVSLILPGVGTIINGETGKGVAILVGYFAALFIGFLLLIVLIGFFFLLVATGVWIWGMIDAYQGAQKWNYAHGFIS